MVLVGAYKDFIFRQFRIIWMLFYKFCPLSTKIWSDYNKNRQKQTKTNKNKLKQTKTNRNKLKQTKTNGNRNKLNKQKQTKTNKDKQT